MLSWVHPVFSSWWDMVEEPAQRHRTQTGWSTRQQHKVLEQLFCLIYFNNQYFLLLNASTCIIAGPLSILLGLKLLNLVHQSNSAFYLINQLSRLNVSAPNVVHQLHEKEIGPFQATQRQRPSAGSQLPKGRKSLSCPTFFQKQTSSIFMFGLAAATLDVLLGCSLAASKSSSLSPDLLAECGKSLQCPLRSFQHKSTIYFFFKDPFEFPFK